MLNYEKIENIDIKEKFINDFSYVFNKVKSQKEYPEVTFLCVGTDRITGDCFGPLVGSKLIELLKEYNYSNVNIYGTLEQNLNYENINRIIKHINNQY